MPNNEQSDSAPNENVLTSSPWLRTIHTFRLAPPELAIRALSFCSRSNRRAPTPHAFEVDLKPA